MSHTHTNCAQGRLSINFIGTGRHSRKNPHSNFATSITVGFRSLSGYCWRWFSFISQKKLHVAIKPAKVALCGKLAAWADLAKGTPIAFRFDPLSFAIHDSIVVIFCVVVFVFYSEDHHRLNSPAQHQSYSWWHFVKRTAPPAQDQQDHLTE